MADKHTDNMAPFLEIMRASTPWAQLKTRTKMSCACRLENSGGHTAFFMCKKHQAVHQLVVLMKLLVSLEENESTLRKITVARTEMLLARIEDSDE